MIFPRYQYGWMFLILSFWLPGYGQNPVPDPVMQYLKNRSFPQLIEQYGSQTIHLTLPSRRTRQLDSLPYQLQQGFRVQVIATKFAKVARRVFQQVQQLGVDSVYLVEETGLYKVQVGNFTQRDSARKMLDRLYYAGFKDAWIAPATIHLPKLVSSSATPLMYYAIQIFASRHEKEARKIQQQYAHQLNWPVWIERMDHLWKVLVGKFTEEATARQVLEKLRLQGWNEAWLTQVWLD